MERVCSMRGMHSVDGPKTSNMGRDHIYVPSDFCLLVQASDSWIPIQKLCPSVNVWSEDGFIEVHIERCVSQSKVNCYAIIDAVTTLGIDTEFVDSVQVNYHWMPPWVTRAASDTRDVSDMRDGRYSSDVGHRSDGRYSSDVGHRSDGRDGSDVGHRSDVRDGSDDPNSLYKCKETDHQIKALIDFLPQQSHKLDTNFIDCKLPLQRYKTVCNSPCMSSLYSYTQGRYKIIRVPKDLRLCESSFTSKGRNHSLAYINMVISLKGTKLDRTKSMGRHVEVKDKGAKLKCSSFRRLRRSLTSCAVRNTYMPKVHRLKDGNPYVKRRLRLQLDSDGIARCVEVKEKVRHSTEFHCMMRTLPTNNQSAYLVPMLGNVPPLTWYKVTLSRGTSLALEGVMLRLKMKDSITKT